MDFLWALPALPKVPRRLGDPALTEQEGLAWGVIRSAMSSSSALCMAQMQDYLELGGEARMNFPGTQSGDNWTWRADPGFMSEALALRIRSLTGLYDRLGVHKRDDISLRMEKNKL